MLGHAGSVATSCGSHGPPQAISMHPAPAGAQIPQLALQQYSPAAHVVSPQGLGRPEPIGTTREHAGSASHATVAT